METARIDDSVTFRKSRNNNSKFKDINVTAVVESQFCLRVTDGVARMHRSSVTKCNIGLSLITKRNKSRIGACFF